MPWLVPYFQLQVRLDQDGGTMESHREWPIAIHEAGHVVAATVMGIPLEFATIRAGATEDAAYLGLTRIKRSDDYFRKIGEDVEFTERLIIQSWAGTLAENRAGVHEPGDWSHDRETVADLAIRISGPDVNGLVERLRVEADRLLEAHWEVVERVAEALIQHETLTADHLKKLLHELRRDA